VTSPARFLIRSHLSWACSRIGCRLLLATGLIGTVAPATAQQYVMPVPMQPAQVPVNRIQAPGYVPPRPVARRPWWFTVQTVSGPGTVVPVARITNYRPQPFRFPANAPVLAGKPILPPAGTPPSQWATAPAVVPGPPDPQPAAPVNPPVQATPPPPAFARQPAPPAPAQMPPPAPSAPSGQWATVAIDASQPQPNAVAVTIPATPGSMLAAATPATPVPTHPVSHPGNAPPAQPPVPAPVAWWRCIGVTDGDTLTCLDDSGRQQKVALIGVDAPEPGQPYGRQARESLAELVFGKRIAVAVSGRDAAGQAICQVSVDGRDVSGLLVAAGAAWADPASGSSLIPEQQQARDARKGLWDAENPQPPWEFRNAGEASWQPSA